MNYKAIVACDENLLIGNGLEIPWRISEDFKHFKATTMGGILVFGKNTWLSLNKKALIGRENTILSSTLNETPPEGAIYFKNRADLEAHYKNDQRQIWICGGAKIYEEFLADCSEIIMSEIKGTYSGDTYFPEFKNSFKEAEIILKNPQFEVIKYKKIEKS